MCRFVTKSVSLGPLMECIALDSQKVQLPEHRAWLKEKGEALFGCPTEQVRTLGTLPSSRTVLHEYRRKRLMHGWNYLVPATFNAGLVQHGRSNPAKDQEQVPGKHEP